MKLERPMADGYRDGGPTTSSGSTRERGSGAAGLGYEAQAAALAPGNHTMQAQRARLEPGSERGAGVVQMRGGGDEGKVGFSVSDTSTAFTSTFTTRDLGFSGLKHPFMLASVPAYFSITPAADGSFTGERESATGKTTGALDVDISGRMEFGLGVEDWCSVFSAASISGKLNLGQVEYSGGKFKLDGGTVMLGVSGEIGARGKIPGVGKTFEVVRKLADYKLFKVILGASPKLEPGPDLQRLTDDLKAALEAVKEVYDHYLGGMADVRRKIEAQEAARKAKEDKEFGDWWVDYSQWMVDLGRFVKPSEIEDLRKLHRICWQKQAQGDIGSLATGVVALQLARLKEDAIIELADLRMQLAIAKAGGEVSDA